MEREEVESTIHHEFIVHTDRKSLFTQIKNMVVKAQEIASGELQERREGLQKLLEYEDKIYEDEFAKKVKSRIDEDIKKRKELLLKIKEQNTRDELDFLKRKRVQQYMNSSYEIREALRVKEAYEVKECQIEQMLENERAERRRRDLDQYWADVQRTNNERLDERHRNEMCLRNGLNSQLKFVLDKQVEDKQRQLEEERRENMAAGEKIQKEVEKMRLEEFDSKRAGVSPKMQKYRLELMDMWQEKEAKERAEAMAQADEHRQLVSDLQRLEAEDNAAAHARKRAFYKATMEYIDYVKRMRKLEEGQEKMRNDRADDLRHVDVCTKSNIVRAAQRKAEIAEKCYAELRQQICDRYEARLREEAEHREVKMLENRFATKGITREQILAQRRKNREGLDKQIAELKRLRAEEQAKCKKDFLRASNDPQFCAELAEIYTRDGVDYLEPHANWRILVCPNKQYTGKPPCTVDAEAVNSANPCGKQPDPKNSCGDVASCIKPCGCEARWAETGCCSLPLPGVEQKRCKPLGLTKYY